VADGIHAQDPPPIPGWEVSMKKTHLMGLALWRTGVILVGGYLAYQGLRTILSITDGQLELAVAILVTGILFVFLSVVGERILDLRTERGQGE